MLLHPFALVLIGLAAHFWTHQLLPAPKGYKQGVIAHIRRLFLSLMYSPDASFRIFSMNNSTQHNNGPPGSNNPRDNTPSGQYIYQGSTIKKVLDKNEACMPCRRRKTKCDVSANSQAWTPGGLAEEPCGDYL